MGERTNEWRSSERYVEEGQCRHFDRSRLSLLFVYPRWDFRQDALNVYVVVLHSTYVFYLDSLSTILCSMTSWAWHVQQSVYSHWPFERGESSGECVLGMRTDKRRRLMTQFSKQSVQRFMTTYLNLPWRYDLIQNKHPYLNPKRVSSNVRRTLLSSTLSNATYKSKRARGDPIQPCPL